MTDRDFEDKKRGQRELAEALGIDKKNDKMINSLKDQIPINSKN